MKRSAALLVYSTVGHEVRVLLVHPGGPFWKAKDDGAWSLPKGEYDELDDPLVVARREFEEEVGVRSPNAEPVDLGNLRQPSGKWICCFALAATVDLSSAAPSNTFELEWPRGSGQVRAYPEVDRREWFSLAAARTKLIRGQVPFLDRLSERVGSSGGGDLPGRASSSEQIRFDLD